MDTTYFELNSLLELIKQNGEIVVSAATAEEYDMTLKNAKAFLKKHGYNEKGEKIK